MNKAARDEVQKLIAEASDHHNDGYVMAGFKEELQRIYEQIGNFLFSDARDLKAVNPNLNEEYIYESPDRGKTIYRREFGKSEREVIKDWKKNIEERKALTERANKDDKKWSGKYEDFAEKEPHVDKQAIKNVDWYENWKKENFNNEK